MAGKKVKKNEVRYFVKGDDNSFEGGYTSVDDVIANAVDDGVVDFDYEDAVPVYEVRKIGMLSGGKPIFIPNGG